MKKLEFILLSLLAACSPVTEKIESNIVVPRIQYTGGADNASYSEAALLHKDLKCKAPLIEPNLRRNLGKWST